MPKVNYEDWQILILYEPPGRLSGICRTLTSGLRPKLNPLYFRKLTDLNDRSLRSRFRQGFRPDPTQTPGVPGSIPVVKSDGFRVGVVTVSE